jgi:hypothetical protein
MEISRFKMDSQLLDMKLEGDERESGKYTILVLPCFECPTVCCLFSYWITAGRIARRVLAIFCINKKKR